MRKTNLILATVLLLPFFSLKAQEQLKKETIYFLSNEAVLDAEDRKQLDSLAELLQSKPFNVSISGHTDADGSLEYNESLANKRVQAVSDYLKSKGVAAEALVDAHGELKPVALNNNETGKQKNRRVDVYLIPQKEEELALQQGPWRKKAQQFKINSAQNERIVGEEGTIIDIPAGTFATRGMVTVYLEEYYQMDDILMASLNTKTSEGEMLETKGMINLSALQGKREVKVRKGRKVKIFFPDREYDDDYQLFSGNHAGDHMFWDGIETTTARDQSSSGYNFWFFIGDVLDVHSLSRWSSWKETIEGERVKITKIDRPIRKDSYDTVLVSREEQVQDLMLESGSLGWINCDRFYKVPNEKIDLFVKVDKEIAPSVSLVFKDINSVMPGHKRGKDTYVFKNVPVRFEATIVALKASTEKEIYFSMKDIEIKKGKRESVELALLSDEEVRMQMKSLGKKNNSTASR